LVDIELTVELSEVLLDRLGEGKLDLVMAKGDGDGLLWTEPLVWVGPPDFVLDAGGAGPLAVYPSPSITRTRVLDVVAGGGDPVANRMRQRPSQRVARRRAGGLGVGAFAASLVPEGLVVLDGVLPTPGNVGFILRGRNTHSGGAIAELATALQAHTNLAPGPGATLRSTALGTATAVRTDSG